MVDKQWIGITEDLQYNKKPELLCFMTKCIVMCWSRIDMTLEFPRPLMPNTILVGGINCNVRDALPEVSCVFSFD